MRKRFVFWKIVCIALIMLCLGLAVFLQFFVPWTKKEAVNVAEQIRQILPAGSVGIEGEYTDPEMPAMEYDGTDYVCLLEVPAWGISLPVQNSWEPAKLVCNPCRYTGSSYDGTLVLGGSNQDGQFAFCGKVDLGDSVIITDMLGSQFTYKVQSIERSKSIEDDKVQDELYKLILFVRERFSDKYIIVKCGL
jgi:sortase A